MSDQISLYSAKQQNESPRPERYFQRCSGGRSQGSAATSSVSVSTRTHESASPSTSEACTERSAKGPGTSSRVRIVLGVVDSRTRTRM